MPQKTKPSTPKVTSLHAVKKPRPRASSNGTTKKAQLIQMLSRKSGADVTTIGAKLGWLPHTTRAAVSGLRKSGFEITLGEPGTGKPSRYHIIAQPVADAG